MAVRTALLPLSRSAPTSDIKARTPPSPRLSARMTKRQYFTEIVIISVQTINESTPSAEFVVKRRPAARTTVCKV